MQRHNYTLTNRPGSNPATGCTWGQNLPYSLHLYDLRDVFKSKDWDINFLPLECRSPAVIAIRGSRKRRWQQWSVSSYVVRVGRDHKEERAIARLITPVRYKPPSTDRSRENWWSKEVCLPFLFHPIPGDAVAQFLAGPTCPQKGKYCPRAIQCRGLW